MSRTKLDPIHIQQYVFDEDTESNRVKIVGTEMQIELSAEDGDSVTIHPKGFSLDQKDVAMNCVGMKSCKLYTQSGTVTVQVSPKDEGNYWVDWDGQPLCARRIRMAGTGEAVLVVQAV